MFLIDFQFSTMASSVPERSAVDNGALRAIAFQSAWLTCFPSSTFFHCEWLTIRHIQGKLSVYFILLQNSAYEYCAQGFRAPRL